ncbi:MAG: lipid-A-disaccharide synthase [Chlorobium sp.]|uniref:lipid-A-disaccharide synthase n=1 Tax=Chlorobium sp. TaxID=1095 RepID=UPI0025C4CDD6|nr:lipid-A-disaccharide synthase [Chlorobium sp.]MCF8382558.1 lipid-A-disaccharide synthase [Chlorobium sp.]
MPKKLFVLAGEVSGDMHAAGVVAGLLGRRPDVRVFGIGGERLRELGAELAYDTRQMSIMGFVDVLRHAGFLKKVIREMKARIREEMPDVALLVDYPGMNLLIARFLHDLGIPVIYYIAPQVWAWKEGRVRKIRETVDRLLVIFDFEVAFYSRHGVTAEFVGNPVIEELHEEPQHSVSDFRKEHDVEEGAVLIGLLPGSRRQEISMMLPEMLRAAEMLAGNRNAVFLLGRAPHLDYRWQDHAPAGSRIRVVECPGYDVMKYSAAAIVTSGTATLEALCFGMPMVVVYRTGWLNYQIGKRLVKLKSISLANIVSKGLGSTERVVPELIQHEANAAGMAREVGLLLDDPVRAGKMRAELLEARARLASASPSRAVSMVIEEYL